MAQPVSGGDSIVTDLKGLQLCGVAPLKGVSEESWQLATLLFLLPKELPLGSGDAQ